MYRTIHAFIGWGGMLAWWKRVGRLDSCQHPVSPKEPQRSEEDDHLDQHLLTQVANDCKDHHTSIKPAPVRTHRHNPWPISSKCGYTLGALIPDIVPTTRVHMYLFAITRAVHFNMVAVISNILVQLTTYKGSIEMQYELLNLYYLCCLGWPFLITAT